jgi:hypothetical protein
MMMMKKKMNYLKNWKKRRIKIKWYRNREKEYIRRENK